MAEVFPFEFGQFTTCSLYCPLCGQLLALSQHAAALARDGDPLYRLLWTAIHANTRSVYRATLEDVKNNIRRHERRDTDDLRTRDERDLVDALLNVVVRIYKAWLKAATVGPTDVDHQAQACAIVEDLCKERIRVEVVDIKTWIGREWLPASFPHVPGAGDAAAAAVNHAHAEGSDAALVELAAADAAAAAAAAAATIDDSSRRSSFETEAERMEADPEREGENMLRLHPAGGDYDKSPWPHYIAREVHDELKGKGWR